MKSFDEFERFYANKANAVEKLIKTKYGRKSVSAADDAQYRRELEIAVDAATEMLRRYHDWCG